MKNGNRVHNKEEIMVWSLPFFLHIWIFFNDSIEFGKQSEKLSFAASSCKLPKVKFGK